jgi:pimeloyl-ACP methyl ester carboxylesterase
MGGVVLRLPEGARVSYAMVGRGTPVLAMPGGPGFSADYLSSFAEGLTDRMAWYLVDPPGTGETTPPTRPKAYSIDGHARFYRDVAQALDLGRYVVFGHSYSAVVALTMAARYQEEVLACLVAAPPVLGIAPDRAEGGSIRAAMDAALARHQGQPWFADAVESLRSGFAASDQSEVEMHARHMLPLYFSHPTEDLLARARDLLAASAAINVEASQWFYEKEWEDLDLRYMLPDVACPTLAVVGEHDWYVPPEQARLIGRYVPGGRVAEIPDCGHMPGLEAPEAYREAVLDWLDSGVSEAEEPAEAPAGAPRKDKRRSRAAQLWSRRRR